MVASGRPARPGTSELACATSLERPGGEIPAREGTNSANTGVSLEHEAHVGALWEAIASAADHAETLEEASQECLDAVCHLTGWPVGHLYLVLNDDLVSTSVWHLQEPERFAALRRATASTRLTIGRGLPGEVLATRQPVWIDDLSRHPNFPRARVAGELGVRSGFAFPVIVGSEVVAVLEFFSPTHVALDQALLELVARVGSQLSRVAERRRAAVRLASTDERLRRILETANESFISMDSGGSVTEWNQCAESTFGWARHEVLGRSLAELLVPAPHREAHRRGVERFVATGEGKVVGTTIELTALHRRGHEIPIELAIWAFDEGGEWSFNALIRDISARKDAEARLRASERRLAEAQQVAGVGSWEWDLATNDVAWSDELYRIYGVAPEVTQASPTAFLELVDVRDRPRVVETLGAAMASGTPFDTDFRVNRPDGCLRVIHARGEVLWEAGQAVRMRGTARDVTERRRSEEELRGLRAALESAVEGMAQVDSHGRYLSVNEGYAAMCRARPQELIGLDWTSIVHPDDHEKVLAGYRQMVEVGRGVLEVSGVRLGGSQLDLRMVLVSSYDGDGRFVGHVCCMQDITARKRAEEELRNLLTRERQMVERLTELDQEKTDFVSCVSHELRTPLTSMLGFLELLTGGDAGTLTTDQTQMLEVVNRNARRLLSRIDDLLTVSRAEAGTLRLSLGPVVLEDLANAAVVAMTPTLASRHLELAVEVAEGAGAIIGDTDQLDRVFINLLSNAVKFTPDGGCISLRVWREGASVSIVVADNGIGVPADEQSRLFQRFYRSSIATEMAIPGTGLGLVIIRSIVEQHQGRIELRSSPGVGTEVTVTLPVDPALCGSPPDDDHEMVGAALPTTSALRPPAPW